MDDRPSWLADAFRMQQAVVLAGCRIARFRLTAEQLEDLYRFTRQRERLLGYPVVLR